MSVNLDVNVNGRHYIYAYIYSVEQTQADPLIKEQIVVLSSILMSPSTTITAKALHY